MTDEEKRVVEEFMRRGSLRPTAEYVASCFLAEDGNVGVIEAALAAAVASTLAHVAPDVLRETFREESQP